MNRRERLKRKETSKSKNIIKKIISGTFFLLALAVLVIIFQHIRIITDKDYIPNIFGNTYLNVLSHSMEPEIYKNDLILGSKVTDSSNLQVGDIITYKNGNMLITHRIIEVIDGKSFVTKGDANEFEDSKIVLEQDIVSKVVYTIPKGGYVVAKLQDPMFLLLFWGITMYFIIKEMVAEYKKMKNKTVVAEETPQINN